MFNGTSVTGRSESFQYTSPGFIGALTVITIPEMNRCSPCLAGPIFAPDNGDVDQIDFSDSNNAGYAYIFPLDSFREPGTHNTVSISGNAGTLSVQVTSDLAVANAAAFEFC